MRKYNIALAGTFDIENYGDLMFPVVFEGALKKRGLKFNLFLFSPSDSGPKALSDSETVYSFKDFERLNNEVHFDALAIGGGAIIHFHDIPVSLQNGVREEKYHNIHSWFSLIYLAAKNNIKIIFNLPQLPYEVTDGLKPLMKKTFEQIDYLAVRDEISAQRIKNLYDEKEDINVLVYPDAVCIIDELFDSRMLASIRRDLLGFDGHYAVVHFSRWIPEEAYSEVKKAINILSLRGIKTVLVPLGYTHGDEKLLMEFNDKYCDGECVILREKLDIMKMTAILAGCDYYIGTSFHGIVVSVAYGGKAINFNYPEPTLKNREIYKMYGIENCLAYKCTDISEILKRLISGRTSFSPNRDDVKKRVNKYFDDVYALIRSKSTKVKTPEKILEEMFLIITGYDFCMSNYPAMVTKLELVIKDREKKIAEMEKEIELIRDSAAFKIGKVFTKIPGSIKRSKKAKTEKKEKIK